MFSSFDSMVDSADVLKIGFSRGKKSSMQQPGDQPGVQEKAKVLQQKLQQLQDLHSNRRLSSCRPDVALKRRKPVHN